MAGSLEIELKLAAETEAPLEVLSGLERLGPAVLGPAQTVTELDRYLDTADGRLEVARWACRLRTRDGRTVVSLKGPARHEPGDALHRRPEVEGPAGPGDDPAGWPASEARDLVTTLAAGAPLRELLALHQQRTERPVTLGARRLATLSLDRARVVSAGRERGRLRVVELELAPGVEPDAARDVVDALRRLPGLVPEPASKLERAVAMTGPASGAER